MPSEVLEVQFLGGFLINGSSLPRLHSDKERYLLALLLLGQGQEWSREEWAQRLWPDRRDSLKYLAQALSRVRNALGELAWLLPSRKRGAPVCLHARQFRSDLQSFEQAYEAGDVDAVRRLYRGAFMLGVNEAGLSEEARAWLVWERTRLEMMFRASLGDADGLRAAWNGLCRQYEAERLRTAQHSSPPDYWLEPEACMEKWNWFARLDADASRRRVSQGRSAEHRMEPPIDRSSGGTLPNIDAEQTLEPATGALALESRFYVRRPADDALHSEIVRRTGIICIRGPRQVGKTSLLARGLQTSREAGDRVIVTDLQRFADGDFGSAERLLTALTRSVARQLGLDLSSPEIHDPQVPPAENLTSCLLAGIASDPAPLVWGVDEVDRLMGFPFRGELFGLFRSWYSARALEPGAGWLRFTVMLAHSTEPHLFIPDLTQSPFNVGKVLSIADFAPDQVQELNSRYGSPLRDEAEFSHFLALVEGHPYLVQQGLREMAAANIGLQALRQRAREEEFVFGDHLVRMRTGLMRDPQLTEAVRVLLRDGTPPSYDNFYRLRSAGILSGESPAQPRLRCSLYADYLRQYLL